MSRAEYLSYMKTYNAARRAERKFLGLCRDCSNTVEGENTRCDTCMEVVKIKPMLDTKKTTPEEVLSRALKPDPLTPVKMQAFFSASEIAMKAVIRAGAAGNAQCQQAVKEMEPFLSTMKQK